MCWTEINPLVPTWPERNRPILATWFHSSIYIEVPFLLMFGLVWGQHRLGNWGRWNSQKIFDILPAFFFSRLTRCMSSCCFLSMESLLSSIIDFGWGGLVASHFDDYLHIFHCWHHDSRDRFVSSLLVSRIPTMIGCSLTPQFGGKKYCKEILIHFSINLEVRFSLQSIHLLDFIRKWSGILLKTILFCKFYSEIWRFPVFFV